MIGDGDSHDQIIKHRHRCNDKCRLLVLHAKTEGGSFFVDLIKSGADVRHTQDDGNSALSLAAGANNLEVVKVLISHGAVVDHLNNEGKTPLILAIENGHIRIAEELLAKGANIYIEDNQGWSPLFHATDTGHCSIVKLLLKKGADPNKRNDKKITALMIAAKTLHTDVVEVLLKNKAEVNAATVNGWTPLMYAAQHNRQDNMKLLLTYDANPNSATKENWTALCMAARNRSIDIVRHLLDKKADINHQNANKWTPLMLASQETDHRTAKLLVERRADLNLRNKDNLKAVQIAASRGLKDTVKVLLDEKNDLEFIKNCQSALFMAACRGQESVVELLISKEFNTRGGSKALVLAAHKGHTDIVQLLLANGARLNYKNDDGCSALVAAAAQGHVEIVKLLLGPKCDIDSLCSIEPGSRLIPKFQNLNQPATSRKVDGNRKLSVTALHAAVLFGRGDCVKALIHAKADVNKANENGTTPLKLAALRKPDNVTQLLKCAGAKEDICSKAYEPLYDFMLSMLPAAEQSERKCAAIPPTGRSKNVTGSREASGHSHTPGPVETEARQKSSAERDPSSKLPPPLANSKKVSGAERQPPLEQSFQPSSVPLPGQSPAINVNIFFDNINIDRTTNVEIANGENIGINSVFNLDSQNMQNEDVSED